RVGNMVADFFAPAAAETRRGRRVTVQLLPAVAGEIVTAQEILVLETSGCVYILRNDVAAGTSYRFALRGSQRGHHSTTFFERGVIHQVVPQDIWIADARMEQNTRGFQSAR